MNIAFYFKLARTGMKKNGRLYLPYLLTCMGMVAMCYIISFLSVSETLKMLLQQMLKKQQKFIKLLLQNLIALQEKM